MKGAPEAGGSRRAKIRVLHVITRMIVGGAQENTLLSCALADPSRFESEILTGEETGLEGELLTETRRRGVPLHLEPALVRDPDAINDLRAVVRLTRFLRRHRHDVVHTHTAKAGVIGRIAARLAGVRHVVSTIHGWGFHPRLSRRAFAVFSSIERACAPLCRVLVVVAARDRDEGLALGIGRPQQYRVVRSGIEIEAYRDVEVDRERLRAGLGIPAPALVVGSVGRLSEQKAPLDLVRAFAHLARVRDDAHLLMVGDGPLRDEVERRVAELGLAGRVHLTGIRRDVPALLRAMDIFALTSRWEGLPRVFPQAMCAGLPIVATDVDGAAEIVVPGENGWLVEVDDVEGFGTRLVELASDAGARARLGARGRARVEEYSADRMVRQLEAIYSALVEGRPVPTGPADLVAPARAGDGLK